MTSQVDLKCKTVINIFGGPGVGKSLIAAGLFYRMKCAGMSVELIPEFAKELTYELRHDILTEDQLYIFAVQHRRLFTVAKAVEYVIVDSPLLLTQMYHNNRTNMTNLQLLMPVVLQLFNRYRNQNFLLTRNPAFEYQDYGRSQTKKEAQEIDTRVEEYLRGHTIPNRSLMSTESTVELIFQDIVADEK